MSIEFFKECSAYNGIPNSSGSLCCAKSCGTCGGSGCSNRPGGKTNCCAGEITKTCGLNQKAPCRPPKSEFAKKYTELFNFLERNKKLKIALLYEDYLYLVNF